MAAPAAQSRTQAPPEKSDKLYMENTLLRVAGALFSHDAKRASTRTDLIELNKEFDKRIIIRPDPKLGQPGPLAHKVFVALMKKYSDYGTPVQNQISFTQRELARLIGRADFGGKDSEALSRALHEIHYAFIRACFKNGKGKYVEDSFNVFSRLIIERRALATDPVEACTITIADPIVASLRDDHFTCLNYFLMQRLGTIGQALYMRLFFHLATLYETSKSRRQLLLTKQYEDICNEWLGGLKVLDRKSKILGEQLGRHLEQLKGAHFLASFAIDKAKTRAGFTITFRPGPAFFIDYDRYYRRKLQGNLQFEYHGDRRDLHEPMQIAAMFMAKRTGKAHDTVADVLSTDVEVARELISELGFQQLPKFLDYALRCAKKTKFDVQRLAGLRQYVASFREITTKEVATSKQRAADQEGAARQLERDTYERWCETEIRRRMAALPAAERAQVEAAERARHAGAGPLQGSLAGIGVQIALRKLINQRQPLPTFEAWKQERP